MSLSNSLQLFEMTALEAFGTVSRGNVSCSEKQHYFPDCRLSIFILELVELELRSKNKQKAADTQQTETHESFVTAKCNNLASKKSTNSGIHCNAFNSSPSSLTSGYIREQQATVSTRRATTSSMHSMWRLGQNKYNLFETQSQSLPSPFRSSHLVCSR